VCSAFVDYRVAVDRLDVAHAVEVRLLFLDHELYLTTTAVVVRPTTTGELVTVHGCHVAEEAVKGVGV